jgi:hypothetical protein
LAQNRGKFFGFLAQNGGNHGKLASHDCFANGFNCLVKLGRPFSISRNEL